MGDRKCGAGRPALSCRAAVELAAPHTWPAAVLPVALGTALAAARGAALRPWGALCTLATAVFLQAAVNTLNDYRDFVSGVDTAENCRDETDAALIYAGASPGGALRLGLLFLGCAAVFGGILTALCSRRLLIYGGAALLALLLYTLPKCSFSALPLGELLSGGTMGGVLTCAAYRVQSGAMDWRTVLYALPAVLTIGCIMLVNNTCDLEKDRAGRRHTLAVCIGRPAAQTLLRAALLAALLAVTAIVLLCFPGGAAAVPVLWIALPLQPAVRDLCRQPLSPARRAACMRGVLTAHQWMISVYAVALTLCALGGAANQFI